MTPRRRLRPGNILVALLRRLLYLVIRTQVTPERPEALGIDPRKPVCYVLEDRHLSSLLVLAEETARLGLPSPLEPLGSEFAGVDRAVFSVIINRNPLSRRTTAPSAALAQMSAVVLQEPTRDVQLVPVTVLWGRSPGSQDSLVEALLADAWASVGPLRQLLIILVHGRKTRVSFNANVSLSRVIEGEPDASTAARKANRFLRFHFRRMREAAIGPDLSHRHNLIEAMIATATLREAMAEETRRTESTWRRPKPAHADSPGRSHRTSAIPSFARSSSCSGGYGIDSTTRSSSTTAKSSPLWLPARASFTCPTIAATSIICCSRTSSARRVSPRPTSQPATT
jgi:glycerol-3-phosphate O-acyltransferase